MGVLPMIGVISDFLTNMQSLNQVSALCAELGQTGVYRVAKLDSVQRAFFNNKHAHIQTTNTNLNFKKD